MILLNVFGSLPFARTFGPIFGKEVLAIIPVEGGSLDLQNIYDWMSTCDKVAVDSLLQTCFIDIDAENQLDLLDDSPPPSTLIF